MNFRREILARTGLLALLPLIVWPRIARCVAPWLAFRPAAFEVAADSALIWVSSCELAPIHETVNRP